MIIYINFFKIDFSKMLIKDSHEPDNRTTCDHLEN